MIVRPVNTHDTLLFPDSLEQLLSTANLLGLDIFQSYLTLDPGFDSEANARLIKFNHLIPVIKPNPRRAGDVLRYARLDAFEPLFPVYVERVNIERCFAWKHKYRKLVIRYEKLQATFMGFRYLAYTMINFREVFEKDL